MQALFSRDHRAADRQVLRLAWPCILENLTVIMISFIDAAMIGVLGPAATAAVGVNASPSWLLSGLVQSLGVGGTALVARLIGAGEHREAGRVSALVLRMALLLSAFLTVLMLFGAPAIPIMMNADASIVEEAVAYMRLLALGFIPHYTGIAAGAMIRGAGDTKTPMAAGLLSNGLNVVLNFFLIYEPRTVHLLGLSLPLWGAGMGVRGAAAASALATGISGAFLLLSLPRKKSVLRVQWRAAWDGQIVRRVLRVAYPAALERAAINLGQIMFARMVSSVGVAAFAAHNQSIQVESLGYMPAHGFAAAATTLVGQGLGAGRPEDARERGGRAIFLCLLLLTGVGAFLFAAAPFLISLLTPDAEVRAIGAMLIRICAFEQPFNALSIVTAGALRGAGDTKVPFYYSLVSMWGVRIALAWVLGTRLGFGVAGFWWAMVADLGVRGTLLVLRFRRGRWVNARV
ncbi:MAG: MATE family efflux transporter [Clostridia bacterium]|nr:MATE family efflux transporter [Clostridia bacterium]